MHATCLHKPVELGPDGLDAFRDTDRVMEDRLGGVDFVSPLQVDKKLSIEHTAHAA